MTTIYKTAEDTEKTQRNTEYQALRFSGNPLLSLWLEISSTIFLKRIFKKKI